MKRILLTICSVIMVIGLIGCGANETSAVNETTSETQSETQSEAQKSTERETLLSRDRMSYNNDLTYEMISRHPEKYKEKPCKFNCKVLQIIKESNDGVFARVVIDNDYSKSAILAFLPEVLDGRLLVNDELTMYGCFLDLYTYESVMHEKITVPELQAVMIDLH